MAQKYRIYINENTLFLTDSMPEKSNQIQLLDLQSFDFITFYKNLEKGSKKQYVLHSDDPKSEFKKIKKKCVLIKAAGGLVRNANDDYLFIFRNKKWDLPKGKVENGEKMKDAALREVEEECGVKIYKNGEKLCKTYHVYELSGGVVLKKTNWYDMTVKGKPKLIPQKEEGITKAGWFGKNELDPLLENTYLLIFDVLAAGKIL
jgi:8-oxo-dGTP pyrophosphatase MutT (NUDIX family)